MKILSLARLFFSDSSQSRFQDALTTYTEQLRENPFLKGAYLESVLVDIADTKIPHKLGVKPLGYFIASQDANASIWQIASDSTYLTLKASSAVNINVWVF